jgi:hypothetical protein
MVSAELRGGVLLARAPAARAFAFARRQKPMLGRVPLPRLKFSHYVGE